MRCYGSSKCSRMKKEQKEHHKLSFHSTWLRVFQISFAVCRLKCFEFMARRVSRVFIILLCFWLRSLCYPIPFFPFYSIPSYLAAFTGCILLRGLCLCPSYSSVKMMFIKLTPKDIWIGYAIVVFASCCCGSQGYFKVNLKPTVSPLKKTKFP